MQQQKSRRRTGRRLSSGLWASAVLLPLAGGAAALIGNYFVNFALARKDYAMELAPADATSTVDLEAMDAGRVSYARLRERVLSDRGLRRETVCIRSEDGLRLEADLYQPGTDRDKGKASGGNHRYVIFVHGYQSGRSTALSRNFISVYLSRGFQVLAPDNRAHGGSEGQYIGMGWLDRRDLLCWIRFLIRRDPKAEICVHGVSMGGAAVMMLSGEALPKQVKALVEDCGYTSVWAEFRSELSYLYRLPAFPVLYLADAAAGLRAGYRFQEASSLRQLRKANRPMLFIHGGADRFVPYEMLRQNFAACKSAAKKMLTVEGAGHAEAYLREPERYWQTVFSFLKDAGLDSAGPDKTDSDKTGLDGQKRSS